MKRWRSLGKAEKIAHDSGVQVQVALVDGDPVDDVLRNAAQVGADSIIVGNCGQNAISTLVGSVAQGVVERGSLPVMAVRATRDAVKFARGAWNLPGGRHSSTAVSVPPTASITNPYARERALWEGVR